MGPVVAAAIIAEVGDFSRFAHPASSSPTSVWPLGNTVAVARAAHAASPRREFHCPHRAVRGRLELPDHTEGRAVDERALPARARKTSRHWPGRRSCACTRPTGGSTARGKRSVVATAAVARELLGFIWSIGQRVPLGA